MTIAMLVLILIAVVGSGSMVAMFAWMFSRMKEVGGGGRNTSELANVSRQLDELGAQLGSMEDEMTRLHDRVDFTERLLEPAKEESASD